MDVALLLFAFLLLLTGLAGSILPVLPGPPLSWVGFLVFHFSELGQFSWGLHLGMFTGMVVITSLDYFIPVWGTKKFGGSRLGMVGAGIGIVAGLFFMPLGILLGPFLGALVFEFFHDASDPARALRSAMGSLIGFLLGTGLKLTYCLLTAAICAWQFF